MNKLIEDAIKLCEVIDNSHPPDSGYEILNIAMEDELGGVSRGSSPRTYYRYRLKNVPRLLREQGVFLETIQGRWYRGKLRDEFLELVEKKYNPIDKATIKQLKKAAVEVGYYKKNESPYFEIDLSSDDFQDRYGEQKGGLYTVLVDMDKARDFVALYSETDPSFDEETGKLSIAGKSIDFSGEIKKKSVELLVANINGIVPKEDFYNIPRGQKNYQKHVKEKGKTTIHDSLNKMFKSIEEDIEANKFFKRTILPVQNKSGYGLFINQSVFTNPKN